MKFDELRKEIVSEVTKHETFFINRKLECTEVWNFFVINNNILYFKRHVILFIFSAKYIISSVFFLFLQCELCYVEIVSLFFHKIKTKTFLNIRKCYNKRFLFKIVSFQMH